MQEKAVFARMQVDNKAVKLQIDCGANTSQVAQAYSMYQDTRGVEWHEGEAPGTLYPTCD